MNVGNQTVSWTLVFYSSLVYSMEVNRTETVWLSTFFTISLIYVQQNQELFFNQMVLGHINFYRIDKNTMEVNGTKIVLLSTFFKISFQLNRKKKLCWYQTVLGPVVFHSIFCIYYVPMGHNSFSLPTFFVIFILCSTEERKSYRFAKTLGGVNYRITFFGGLYLKWKWVTRALQ